MSDPRTAREALLAELMADMDRLLDKQLAAAQAMTTAADRIEAALKAVPTTMQASSETAKGSVGEFITRRVNDATANALQSTRQAMEEAAATALGKALLAHQAAVPAPAAPQSPAVWLYFALGVACTAALAAAAWLASR